MEYEYLSLGIGKLEIEWRKNIIGQQDYFELFQPGDKVDILYYFDDDGTVKSKSGSGYSKSLDDVRERLNMLGYSYGKLPALLSEHMQSFTAELDDFKGFKPTKFIELLKAVNIDEIDWVQHEGDAGYGKFFRRRILTLPQFAAVKTYLDEIPNADHYIFEQIDPYIILSALAENPENKKLKLEWRKKGKFTDLDKYKTILIVTEGPTDGAVLKKALHILRPEIADFFDFIDMKENYPFEGVSSMIKFFQGLTKIGTDRRMLFIFDNDSEGRYNFDRLNGVVHPPNMQKILLPDMAEFKNFKTTGATGDAVEDVNGRAVAIEMFLDHRYIITQAPVIQWSGPHTSTQQQQGALKLKTNYYDKFMALEEKDLSKYNSDKLGKLLNMLLDKISN
jgi:hypothetical protein